MRVSEFIVAKSVIFSLPACIGKSGGKLSVKSLLVLPSDPECYLMLLCFGTNIPSLPVLVDSRADENFLDVT